MNLNYLYMRLWYSFSIYLVYLEHSMKNFKLCAIKIVLILIIINSLNMKFSAILVFFVIFIEFLIT